MDAITLHEQAAAFNFHHSRTCVTNDGLLLVQNVKFTEDGEPIHGPMYAIASFTGLLIYLTDNKR